MKVERIHTLINTVTKELVGDISLATEDLSNVVDIGNEIINADAVDSFVGKLVNHIGKIVYDDRVYASNVPSVVYDAWEYGSITQKIIAEIPEATENTSWNLENGTHDPNVFYKPSIEIKLFNDKVTFEVPMSFTEMQVKQSFSSAAQLSGFINMLKNNVDKSLTLKMDSLVMRTINNMIGQTLNAEMPDGDYSSSGNKVINLLTEYNALNESNPIEVDECLTTPEFIRYATYRIGIISDRMVKMSKLFNVGGKARFTPKDAQRMVLLADFKRASDVYLLSDVYHSEKTELPSADVVPYWQGSGINYALDSIGKVKVTVKNPIYDPSEVDTDDPKYGKTKTIESPIVLGVLFDKDSLGVSNLDRRATSNFNPKSEFYNIWHKFDAGYFNDLNENFIVFIVEEPIVEEEPNGE